MASPTEGVGQREKTMYLQEGVREEGMGPREAGKEGRREVKRRHLHAQSLISLHTNPVRVAFWVPVSHFETEAQRG